MSEPEIIFFEANKALICEYCKQERETFKMNPDLIDDLCFQLGCCRNCFFDVLRKIFRKAASSQE